MEYVLTCEKLSKRYGRFQALDECSMHIEKGAIYGFVGKNGAGKTTLLRVICGLQEPSAGTYTLYGRKNGDRGLAGIRRRVGAVVETPAVYEGMTARENLRQQYRILGLPSFDTIPGLLELVGLGDTGKKKVRNFSLGMRQRLGIAVALAGSPDFLILDEPANGLDPEGMIEIRELILKLNRERQITVLISSHILRELSRMATHYGFIDHGRIVQEIRADALERACRKCLRLCVSDTEVLARVFSERHWEYTILSDAEAELYERPEVTELVQTLARESCRVLTIRERDENLEGYYVNLIGGGSHE